ncbi:MAG: SDR family NAD(P)-dependent oxidoreductase [Betaproteobacteria bacterium]|nr:SDR family NAD(P)-dependent oxidoreductase [Betaproteobacteria bacterium]
MRVTELFDLKDRVALVTGGSRGLGLQMAEALGEMGARVAITARKANELEEARAHLVSQGVDVLVHPADLSDPAAAKPLVDAVLAKWGQVDILVNNAGASWGAAAEEHPLEAWHKVMNLNITALFVLSQAVANATMIPRKQGKIINIASIAGFVGTDPHFMPTIAYNSSKGAVVNFTRSLAAEWAQHNIHVNAIAPGVFPSKMSKGMIDRSEQYILEHTPMRRLGSDHDLKGVTALLASAASDYITGTIIPVDGGFLAV